MSVSLLAVAALAASVVLTRQRHEKDPAEQLPVGQTQPAPAMLDAIRTAGL